MIYSLFYKNVLIVFGLALFAVYADAQTVDTAAVYRLPDVVVTEKARRSLTREGAPIQRIDRKAIENLGLAGLTEAVKRFAGVTVTDYGGIGGLKTVSVRGLGAKLTAVSYDGVCITDAQSGQVDIGRFSLDNMDAVSLTIGQSDDIFMPARIYAASGALMLQSSAPDFSDNKKKNSFTAKLKGGSFGLINPMARYERRLNGAFSLSSSVDWLSAKGDYPFTLVNGELVSKHTRKNSDIDALRIEANLNGRFQGGHVRAKLYSYNSERGLPGSIILYSSNTADRLKDDNAFAQASVEQSLGKFTVQAMAKYNYIYSYYKSPNVNYQSGVQEDRNTQREVYGSAGALYRPHPYISASVNADLSRSSLVNNFDKSPEPVRLSLLGVAAAQFKNPRLTVTGSLLATRISDEVKHGSRPVDREHLSPAFSISYRPFGSSAFRIRASYKDLYRAPTFTDLYYLRMGNTRLKPEKAYQYNAGLTFTASAGKVFLNSLSLTADVYYNKVEDKIVAFPTLYIWRMMNTGKVEMSGIDLNASADFSMPSLRGYGLQLSATYSRQKAIDVTDIESKTYRHQIPYTPLNSVAGSAIITTPYVSIGYTVAFTGERYSLPQNIEANRIAGYAEHGVSISRTLTYRSLSLRLQAEALNLANANYDIIQYYPMPGRSFRLNISIYL